MKNYLLIAAMLFGMSASSQQIEKGLTAANNVYIGFYEYKPADYNTNINTRYPLMIFLHGIGERGNGTTELSRVTGIAVPRYIKDGETMTFTWNGKTETFIVLSPQLSSNYGGWQSFYVEEMINYAKKNLRIDTNRISLTGLSLGGGGVWSYAAGSLSNAKKLAAISPTCGTCQNVNWCNISNANLPTWAFHASDDGTVSAGCTNGAVTGINNCSGPVKAYSTIWPTGNHWIWDRSFDRGYSNQNPNVFEWMIAQNKSLAPNKRPVANAGADISSNTNASVTLNASGSTDSDGSIVRYVWRLVSGPSQLNFGGTHTTSPTVNTTGFYVAGTYQIELKAIDNRADWSTDMVTVTVTNGGTTPQPEPQPTNQPPVVKAGADITTTLPASSVTLDGSGTYDPDGPVHEYQWKKIAGPSSFSIASPKTAKTTLSNLVAGTYEFELMAWGDNWVPRADTVKVTVNAATVVANKAPVAMAGQDASITLPSNTASLNGSASYDTDGTIAAYSWTKISGPAQGTLANANAATATAGSLVQGTYNYRLQVTDDKGGICADTVVITVNSAPVKVNRDVVANAGADATITLPVNQANLDGSASYDPDGPILEYQWKKIAGPSSCSIASPKAPKTTLGNLVAGTYQFELMVWGDNWEPRADSVKVIVNPAPVVANKAPLAIAGQDISITLPSNTTSLNGAASYDTDGTIAAYSWTKISGPAQGTLSNANTANAVAGSLAQGTYNYRLQVTDNKGAICSDTLAVTVKAAPVTGNRAVVANAGADESITLPVNKAILDGSASYDPDGPILEYSWRKISGPDQCTFVDRKSAVALALGLVAGTYKFELMVWGDNWEPRADTVVITVKSPVTTSNIAPVVNAGAPLSITLPVNSVTLNGGSSYDIDGSIVSYQWSKISGPDQYTLTNATAASTTVNNLVAGTYFFRLQATDNANASNADTILVQVLPRTNVPPVPLAGNDQVITLPASSVNFDGSASYDVDGPIYEYQWKKIAGPASFSIANAKAAKTSVSNLVAGTYQFELMVWGDNWVPRADTIKVTVIEAAAAVFNDNSSNRISDAMTTTQVKVYPSPATDMINLQYQDGNRGQATAIIYDMSGKVVSKVNFNKDQVVYQRSLNISNLLPGVYYMSVISKDKRTMTSFVKQ